MDTKKKSIKMNAILSMINSILTMGFSLITYPYATRVLLAENLGKVNYANSIVSYFVLIAVLGFSTYAIREGSRIRENKKKVNEFCSEIFSLNLYTVVIAYSFLLLAVFKISKLSPYTGLIMLQSITIFSTWISANWINVIYEDYLSITIRSIAIRIISIILLFILVKAPEDYYTYAAITVVSTLVVDMMNFIYVRRYANLRVVKKLNAKKHMPPVLVFFSNSLAVNIYLNSDTTMIGWIKGNADVGYYSIAVRIYTAIRSVIAAIYSTAIPRMSLYATKIDKNDFRRLLNRIINIVVFISIPSTVALFMSAEEVVKIIAGNSFEEAVAPLRVLSLAFFFAVLGGILAYCVCIPLKKERQVLIATIISAFENITLNIVLIPLYGISGAAITTLIAEMTVAIVLFFNLGNRRKNIFDYRNIGINFLKTLVGTIPIIAIKLVVDKFTYMHWMKSLIIYYTVSIICFFIIEALIKNECCTDIILSVTKKIRRKII